MIGPVTHGAFPHEGRVFLNDAEIVEPRVVGGILSFHHVERCVMPEREKKVVGEKWWGNIDDL